MTLTASEFRERVRWLCVGDLAERYAVSKKTIYRRIDLGDLPPPRRIGRLLRWHPADIERWEASK